jgi:hypothetical protein
MSQNLSIGNIQANGQVVGTEPFSILAGEMFDLTWDVTNLGDEVLIGDGYGISNIDKIYLSDDTVLGGGDVLLKDYSSTTELNPNDSYTGNVSVYVPSNTAINRYLIFYTNEAGVASETNVSDNIKLVPISIETIDLSITQAPSIFTITQVPAISTIGVDGGSSAQSIVSAAVASTIVGNSPVQLVEGRTVRVEWQVDNIGSRDVSAGFGNKVYLSQDNVIDSSDLLLDEYQYGGGSVISGGSYYPVSQDIVLPTIGSSGISGEAYIIVQTDSGDELVESNEANNICCSGIHCCRSS